MLDEHGVDHLENRQIALEAAEERHRQFLRRVEEQLAEQRRPWWKPRVERAPEEPPMWEQPPEVEPPEGWLALAGHPRVSVLMSEVRAICAGHPQEL